MLTCSPTAGFDYLPNFKDVAAAVPLPNFIFASEFKLERVVGCGFAAELARELVSPEMGFWLAKANIASQLPFSCQLLINHAAPALHLKLPSPQHHAALQLNT